MEVFPRFPAHEKAMKTAILLRAVLSIFLVEGLTLSISPNVILLAKSFFAGANQSANQSVQQVPSVDSS